MKDNDSMYQVTLLKLGDSCVFPYIFIMENRK